MKQHWKALTIGAVVVVVVLAVGIPYAYIHFVNNDQQKALTVADAPSTAAGGDAQPVDVTGTWTVGAGSRAGYRVPETLAGQDTTAVGRTSRVTGSLTVAGTSVNAATFTVDMASVRSDESRRDSRFTGSIMETSKFPTGTFTLTSPVDLGSVPDVGQTISARATGNLMLHGVTRPVTLTVQAKRAATQLVVSGSIPISYADYDIDNPSIGGFVSVGSTGTVEFLLVATKSG